MSHILPTYARADVAFERGEGPVLWTADNRRFLDFGGGVAVNVLGHAHPHLVKVLTEQAQKLWHTSNLYKIPQAEKLATRLCEESFADVVFFANSGAEANECALKMARKFHFSQGNPQKVQIITFEGAFHGRTTATVAATGNKKYYEGFHGHEEDYPHLPFGDFEALSKAINEKTAAIMIEPVQGEGGLRPVPAEMLQKLRAIADKHGLLLILDEVQCGIGRTGKFLAHEWAGIVPDICTIAKSIGGGFPLGACLATTKASIGMVAGTHGSTFGGNPLACAVGNGVLDIVLGEGFMQDVSRKAGYLSQRLGELVASHPHIIEGVRGMGLMTGLKCKILNSELAVACREQGLLLIPAGDNVLRLLPPLNISEENIHEAVSMIDKACLSLEARI
jgi:acetylornithine/N-succinyldiaminopimelate aminotransferase